MFNFKRIFILPVNRRVLHTMPPECNCKAEADRVIAAIKEEHKQHKTWLMASGLGCIIGWTIGGILGDKIFKK